MMLFKDLLAEKDFLTAVEGLAGTHREELGLGKIHQLGLVVRDVIESAKELEEKGIGPFFIAEGSPVLWREQGEEKKFHGKMGLAYYLGIELELLEPGMGSDFYRASLDPKGEIVVQHLGFLVKDVDQGTKKFIDKGYPIKVRGQLKAGILKTDFAYMDTDKQAGFILELISWKIMGLNLAPPAIVIKALASLEKWSGKRSISM